MAGGGAATGNSGDSRAQNNGSTAAPVQPFPIDTYSSTTSADMGFNPFAQRVGTPWGDNPQPNYFAPAEPQPINWQPRPDTGQMMGVPSRGPGEMMNAGPAMGLASAVGQPMQPPAQMPLPAQLAQEPEPVFNIKKDYELDSNQLSGADELAQARAQADAQRMAKEQAMMQMRAHEDFMNAGPYGIRPQMPYGQTHTFGDRGLAAQQAIQQGNLHAATLMRGFKV